MPSERAAAEIEPVERIASKSAIFPGPMRAPEARSMRIERCVPAIAFTLRTPRDVTPRARRSSRDFFGSGTMTAPKKIAAAEAAASLAQMTCLLEEL
jgi:hypothetical protein